MISLPSTDWNCCLQLIFCRLQYSLTPSSKESSWMKKRLPPLKPRLPSWLCFTCSDRLCFPVKVCKFHFEHRESAPNVFWVINRVTLIHDLCRTRHTGLYFLGLNRGFPFSSTNLPLWWTWQVFPVPLNIGKGTDYLILFVQMQRL